MIRTLWPIAPRATRTIVILALTLGLQCDLCQGQVGPPKSNPEDRFPPDAQIGSPGSIVGSAHDFSTYGWSDGEICLPCHNAHRTDTLVTDAPLWNHELSDPNQLYLTHREPTGV